MRTQDSAGLVYVLVVMLGCVEYISTLLGKGKDLPSLPYNLIVSINKKCPQIFINVALWIYKMMHMPCLSEFQGKILYSFYFRNHKVLLLENSRFRIWNSYPDTIYSNIKPFKMESTLLPVLNIKSNSIVLGIRLDYGLWFFNITFINILVISWISVFPHK